MRSEENQLPTSEPSDGDLVDRVLAGDVAAYDGLVLKYKERLYGVLYNMTSNHEDANDLSMESFNKAFRALGTFRKNSSFYTWIYRIALNQAINFLRKRRRRYKDLSLNDLDMDESRIPELQDASAIGGDRSAELAELQKKLNESLQKLSEDHRAVVVLYDIDGMSHSDIARIMNCSEGTVRSRLHYAHQKLQKMLSGYLKN
jgi:RNA polymerase sigma-70 factor (ECF subfamily)